MYILIFQKLYILILTLTEERVEEIAEAERELERLRMDRVAYEEYESRQK